MVVAYRLLGAFASIARAAMPNRVVLLENVSPVLTGVQVLPLFMDLKTPVEKDVPAYSVVGVTGSTTIELISGVRGNGPLGLGNPAFSEVQFAPPSIVLNIPLEPPA